MSKRVHYDDGEVGLQLEPLGWKARFLAKPNRGGDQTPEFVGVCHLTRWTEDVVMASLGFGQMSMRHQALLSRVLYARGFKYLFAERGEGTIGFGKIWYDPPFEGWAWLDLKDAAERADRRYPPRYVKPPEPRTWFDSQPEEPS